jgi:hypothetical protein
MARIPLLIVFRCNLSWGPCVSIFLSFLTVIFLFSTAHRLGSLLQRPSLLRSFRRLNAIYEVAHGCLRSFLAAILLFAIVSHHSHGLGFRGCVRTTDRPSPDPFHSVNVGAQRRLKLEHPFFWPFFVLLHG